VGGLGYFLLPTKLALWSPSSIIVRTDEVPMAAKIRNPQRQHGISTYASHRERPDPSLLFVDRTAPPPTS
jgi:hypothetical protein